MKRNLFLYGAVLILTAICLALFGVAHAADVYWGNTFQQWDIMHNSDDSIGPSATYWSQRNMPMYIQNGCTEDVVHTAQACPF